jgi:hypothetical protein
MVLGVTAGLAYAKTDQRGTCLALSRSEVTEHHPVLKNALSGTSRTSYVECTRLAAGFAPGGQGEYVVMVAEPLTTTLESSYYETCLAQVTHETLERQGQLDEALRRAIRSSEPSPELRSLFIPTGPGCSLNDAIYQPLLVAEGWDIKSNDTRTYLLFVD